MALFRILPALKRLGLSLILLALIPRGAFAQPFQWFLAGQNTNTSGLGTNAGKGYFQLFTSGDMVNWNLYADKITNYFFNVSNLSTNSPGAQYYSVRFVLVTGASTNGTTNAAGVLSQPAIMLPSQINQPNASNLFVPDLSTSSAPGMLPLNVPPGSGGGGGGSVTQAWTNNGAGLIFPVDPIASVVVFPTNATTGETFEIRPSGEVFNHTTNAYSFWYVYDLGTNGFPFFSLNDSAGFLNPASQQEETMLDPTGQNGEGARYIFGVNDLGNAAQGFPVPGTDDIAWFSVGTSNAVRIHRDGSLTTGFGQTNQWLLASVTSGIPHATVNGTDYALGGPWVSTATNAQLYFPGNHIGGIIETDNLTGSVSIGADAFSNVPSTSADTAVGTLALNAITTGANNTAVGLGALAQITTPSANTAIGEFAGHAITTGADNTFVGRSAGGFSIGSASKQVVVVGSSAQQVTGTLTNVVVIGYNATSQGGTANTATIGNSSLLSLFAGTNQCLAGPVISNAVVVLNSTNYVSVTLNGQAYKLALVQ